MNQKNTNKSNLEKSKTVRLAIIYTDGSHNPNTNVIACAFMMFGDSTKRPYRVVFRKQLKSKVNYGSSIAEIIAAMTAIKAACSLCYSHIIIYHDWDGVEYFSKCENIKSRHKERPEFIKYANYVEKTKKSIDVSFVKVKAHSSNKFNNLVDKMARSQIMN